MSEKFIGESDGVTPAADWRRHEVVTLPSGKRARLRRPDVIELIMADGQVPDFLTPVVLAGLRGQDVDQQATEFEVTQENIGAIFELVNTIARAAFVEPTISDKPDAELGENEIRLEHVGFGDKTWIMNWAMGAESASAGRFRTEPSGGVGPVPERDGDQHEAVTDRRRRKG